MIGQPDIISKQAVWQQHDWSTVAFPSVFVGFGLLG